MCVRLCVCAGQATHPLMGHLTKLPICSSAQLIPLLMLLLTLLPLPILPLCLLLVLHSIILSKHPILLIPWQSHHFPSSRSPLLAELTSSPLLSLSPPSGVQLQPLPAVFFHPHPFFFLFLLASSIFFLSSIKKRSFENVCLYLSTCLLKKSVSITPACKGTARFVKRT